MRQLRIIVWLFYLTCFQRARLENVLLSSEGEILFRYIPLFTYLNLFLTHFVFSTQNQNKSIQMINRMCVNDNHNLLIDLDFNFQNEVEFMK